MDNPDSQANTRMGKTMIAIGVVIALALLTMFFQNKLDGIQNPNREPLSQTSNGNIEVFLLRNNQGHYVASGSINNVDVEFLLDTGATDVAVSESVARAAGLPYGYQHKAITANGLVDTWDTNIARLELGDIVLRDVNASIIPDMDDNLILLGMSALLQVEFTQQENQLTLRQIPAR